MADKRGSVALRVLSCWCALGAMPALARTDPSSWQLEWQAPETCPSAQVVRDTVQSWLAQSSEPYDTAGIHVRARVQARAEGYALDLVLGSPTGRIQEQLMAAKCETFAGVVALQVALAAESGARGEPMRTPAEPGWSGGARLASGLAPGVLPDATLVASLSGTLRIAWLELELGAGYMLPAQAQLPAAPSVLADFDAFYGLARVCVLPVQSGFELSICVGADYGRMRGRGDVGLEDVRTSSQPWAALVIAPALRWRIVRWFSAWLGIDALVELLRPSFRVRVEDTASFEDLYTSGPLGGRLQLGAELHIE